MEDARGVDDPFVIGHVGIVAGDAAGALEEQPVALLHDVRLVNRGDALAAVALRVLEREVGDARTRRGSSRIRVLGRSSKPFFDATLYRTRTSL